ncbi:heme-binding protein [Micromonospora sp. WMMD1128]|uniref:GlcG/HbpS family heme-binding protein n=1 Tax=unclassified Micromonospora TaxID=2617518 RepID=UPI00248A9462|nr:MULTISPECIES: heme-binding protein [unclassified Micromonospora]WBB75945.1 heme-binding protein [Micromonospora sp. WMMD1128]WFE36269.1 heme-binding protein [Micromonospora sp. WMMD975]
MSGRTGRAPRRNGYRRRDPFLPYQDEAPTSSVPSTVVNRPTIAHAAARAALDAAVARAESMGLPVTVAICDESGVLKAYQRMDGAPLVTVQLAQDKAYTAVGFGLSSDGWYDFIKDDGPLAMGAPAGIDRLVTFGGGFPIRVDGAVVGAIGVSGGHYTQDMEVAEAGLAVLG